METISLHFQNTVQQLITTSDDDTVKNIDIATERDVQTIIKWNQHYPDIVQRSIPDWISQVAQVQPKFIAIDSKEKSFTYKSLEIYSDALAIHLLQFVTKPDTLVPFCFEKSPWSIVAMLAILKAGGSFVPLDPSHPPARWESILDQLNAPVLLATAMTRHMLQGMVKNIVEIDAEFMEKLPVTAHTLPKIHPTQLAYVLFTSGTSGTPKGVMMEHVSVCTSMAGIGKYLGHDESTRTIQFSPYVFDACILEIFGTLFHGGCICVPTQDECRDDLGGTINKMGVTFAPLTASLSRLFHPDDVPQLKQILIGGEANGSDLINLWSSIDARAGIGRAVNCVTWIVNPQNHEQLSPLGCVGELAIQGPTLARGYLHNEVQTAKVFKDPPVWMKSISTVSDRLYLTGDLVRYNCDGTLEFQGRKDNQVKLNGQRIELDNGRTWKPGFGIIFLPRQSIPGG
ncbi:hypothetical protein RJ55_04883 [Drechmeria coniospora]|nr:hypothetical protein RJ55_04883 [Drechmeria coniospora]